MKFPVYVNLVVIGVERYQGEGLEIGLIKTSDGLSLAESKLKHGEKSSDIAVQLVKKYIDMESFDPNLLLLSSVGFVDAPDRYKKVNRADVFHQDIVLIYKVVVPLNACLNNEMEWVNFEPVTDENTPEQRSKSRNLVEYANKQTETFCRDHLNIIDMALHDG